VPTLVSAGHVLVVSVLDGLGKNALVVPHNLFLLIHWHIPDKGQLKPTTLMNTSSREKLIKRY